MQQFAGWSSLINNWLSNQLDDNHNKFKCLPANAVFRFLWQSLNVTLASCLGLHQVLASCHNKCNMAKRTEECPQFCAVPRKSIKLLAETVGISCLSSEAAGALAEDVTYRIRQVIQVKNNYNHQNIPLGFMYINSVSFLVLVIYSCIYRHPFFWFLSGSVAVVTFDLFYLQCWSDLTMLVI